MFAKKNVEHPLQNFVELKGGLFQYDASTIVPSWMGNWVEIQTRSATGGAWGATSFYNDFELPPQILNVSYAILKYTFTNGSGSTVYLLPSMYHFERLIVQNWNGDFITVLPEELHMRLPYEYTDNELQMLGAMFGITEPLGASGTQITGERFGPFTNRNEAILNGRSRPYYYPLICGITQADLPFTALTNDHLNLRFYYQLGTLIQQSNAAGIYPTGFSIATPILYIMNHPLSKRAANELAIAMNNNLVIFPYVEFRRYVNPSQVRVAPSLYKVDLTTPMHRRVAALFFGLRVATGVLPDPWEFVQPSTMCLIDVGGEYLTGRDTPIDLLNLALRRSTQPTRFFEFVPWAGIIWTKEFAWVIDVGADRGCIEIGYNQRLQYTCPASATYDECMLSVHCRSLVLRAGRLYIVD